jgi:hypothetical protein
VVSALACSPPQCAAAMRSPDAHGMLAGSVDVVAAPLLNLPRDRKGGGNRSTSWSSDPSQPQLPLHGHSSTHLQFGSCSGSSQLASLPLSPRPAVVHIVHQLLKRRSMLLLLCVNGVAEQRNVMTAGITLGGERSNSEEVGGIRGPSIAFGGVRWVLHLL